MKTHVSILKNTVRLRLAFLTVALTLGAAAPTSAAVFACEDLFLQRPLARGNLNSRNPYEILGITIHADEASAKTAYVAMMRKYFPTTGGDQMQSREAQLINQAYTVIIKTLKNPGNGKPKMRSTESDAQAAATSFATAKAEIDALIARTAGSNRFEVAETVDAIFAIQIKFRAPNESDALIAKRIVELVAVESPGLRAEDLTFATIVVAAKTMKDAKIQGHFEIYQREQTLLEALLKMTKLFSVGDQLGGFNFVLQRPVGGLDEGALTLIRRALPASVAPGRNLDIRS